MKTRSGFVSNSSSTSFVIALAPDISTPCPHCGRRSVLREAFADADMYSDTGIDSDDLGHIVRTIGECDYPGVMERVRKALDEVGLLHGQGWEILQVRLSYHDHRTRDLLAEEAKRGAVKEIICLE